MSDSYPIQIQHFEVVLLKRGVSEMTAKPSDFQRVMVDAESTAGALQSDAVAAVKSHRPLFATVPGHLSDPEIHARSRELEGTPLDRSKI